LAKQFLNWSNLASKQVIRSAEDCGSKLGGNWAEGNISSVQRISKMFKEYMP
jgi:hypothetical protein